MPATAFSLWKKVKLIKLFDATFQYPTINIPSLFYAIKPNVSLAFARYFLPLQFVSFTER